jgi:hypothetical protein
MYSFSTFMSCTLNLGYWCPDTSLMISHVVLYLLLGFHIFIVVYCFGLSDYLCQNFAIQPVMSFYFLISILPTSYIQFSFVIARYFYSFSNLFIIYRFSPNCDSL